MIQWKSIGRLLTPAALVLALPGMALAADCTEFKGIEHCAIGKARLSTTSSGLEVTGFGGAGMDGVSMRLEGATGWAMETKVPSNAAGDASLVITAFAGGSPSNQLILQQSGPQLGVSSRSASGLGTHKIEVSIGGMPVVGINKVPHLSKSFIKPLDPISDDDDGDHWAVHQPMIPGSGFHYTGGWYQTLSFPTPVLVILPDGQRVQGDRIDLVEEVTGSGGSSPSLDGFHVTGTVDALPITNETFWR